ncbi:MAG: SDR family oxidoreductase [Desulfobacteraceae bacterium]|nr:MAG: SDR family oxidoreductase [Desulfobacteraceae bacterium]
MILRKDRMTDLFSLKGKRFLITGGTRGIGRAISLCFARSGASIIANYVRDFQSAEFLKSEAAEEGLEIDFCRADLTSPKGLEKLNLFIESENNVLSGLIHCAASGVHKPLEELTTRHFDWTFAINVRAFFELVKLILPRLSEGSSIVAVSSKGAVRAIPSYSMVGASKGALESIARHFAAELAPKGIRVNILSPGAVMTDAWKIMPDAEDRLSETIRRTPIGRIVTPEEVALTAQFLCSDASFGIVGHTLVVDGGAGITE